MALTVLLQLLFDEYQSWCRKDFRYNLWNDNFRLFLIVIYILKPFYLCFRRVHKSWRHAGFDWLSWRWYYTFCYLLWGRTGGWKGINTTSLI